MIRVLLGFFCVVLFLPFHANAADDGLIKQSVSVGAVTRDFYVHVPSGFVAGGDTLYPMVMAFHGGGGTAPGMATMTGWNKTADENGFIVVYPEGTPAPGKDKIRTWNAGGCCGPAMEQNVDDVSYVSAIMDYMGAHYRADPQRIYLTGHSNGAMLTYRLACALSERVAAIAPNAGQNVARPCPDARPMPVMHIHGTADQCALYGGGTCGGCFASMMGVNAEKAAASQWECLPVRETLWRRARDYGCRAETEIVAKSGNMVCERWMGCTVYEGEVTLCSVAGGGHNWPGGDTGFPLCQTRPNGILCKKWRDKTGAFNPDIPLNDVIWAFFKRWERP